MPCGPSASTKTQLISKFTSQDVGKDKGLGGGKVLVEKVRGFPRNLRFPLEFRNISLPTFLPFGTQQCSF
jgi:hypothetical protein